MKGTMSDLERRLRMTAMVRQRLNECLVSPYRAAMLCPSPIGTAAKMWEIPLECAVAGFTVDTRQDDSGWHVTLKRSIDAETEVWATGKAKSLIAALTQIISSASGQLDSIESETRAEIAALAA